MSARARGHGASRADSTRDLRASDLFIGFLNRGDKTRAIALKRENLRELFITAVFKIAVRYGWDTSPKPRDKTR